MGKLCKIRWLEDSPWIKCGEISIYGPSSNEPGLKFYCSLSGSQNCRVAELHCRFKTRNTRCLLPSWMKVTIVGTDGGKCTHCSHAECSSDEKFTVLRQIMNKQNRSLAKYGGVTDRLDICDLTSQAFSSVIQASLTSTTGGIIIVIISQLVYRYNLIPTPQHRCKTSCYCLKIFLTKAEAS